MNPWGRTEKKHTAGHFVWNRGARQPVSRDWSLDRAVVSGLEACSWVGICSAIHQGHLAKMPLRVFERQGSESTPVDHERDGILRTPNPDMEMEELLPFLGGHLMLAGDAVGRVVTVTRGGQEIPDEIWPANPDALRPVPAEPGQPGWISHYEEREIGKAAVQVPREQVVHAIRFRHPQKPWVGWSALRMVAHAVDLDSQHVRWNANLVRNEAAPAGVFTDKTIRKTTTLKEVREAVKEAFSGPLHAREPLVLGADATYMPIGLPPKELDWIQSRNFTVGEIASAFWMLVARFQASAMTYDNLATAERYEVLNGSIPLAVAIGTALGRVLLTFEERRRGLFIGPDPSAIECLQETFEKASMSYERLVRNGVPKQTARSSWTPSRRFPA
ncbi:MAG: phage portal protein, partial [Planctomycetota bacterium]